MNESTGGGWHVEPDQVREFAAAVEEVRADLNSIFAEVAELATPAYLPMLGTSPVGQELSEKFTERLAGETGLKGQLEEALRRMEEFVASAERSAAGYQDSDDNSAQRFTNP
ncbi:hypothetical protein [Actinokineospora globicatena]|uniref:Uncharacterized protein n=1 Tax=Actinokineospora globicatena TaxID=103729 RepID=A0A9W6VB50_9PSEU|nr:hypothetical protein [Actinokineospora globicatena]MCP2300421.1 hypothetical protein [Actinokineospora globicatena]GLW80953.1 hypothetical protein Aglo01_54340 [Actinokineospora globicatena]GLW88146.1 hypothetical protein Aglo02_57850 [Actinokineospora globicatena]GLW92628.1 hypothetical protein Aglo03_34440 [Actinokineospora globicatena]